MAMLLAAIDEDTPPPWEVLGRSGEVRRRLQALAETTSDSALDELSRRAERLFRARHRVIHDAPGFFTAVSSEGDVLPIRLSTKRGDKLEVAPMLEWGELRELVAELDDLAAECARLQAERFR